MKQTVNEMNAFSAVIPRASADYPAYQTINEHQYQTLYQASIADPTGFWQQHGQIIDWITPYRQIKNCSFAADDLHIRWFDGGQLNVAANCIDRHLADKAEQIALLWESDDGSSQQQLTYQQLYCQVGQFANLLRANGLKKGDVVAIYLPMRLEGVIAMLACARIGVVHTVIFAGFSAESIAERLVDCQAKLIITADKGVRAGKTIPLKANIDRALQLINATASYPVIVLNTSVGEYQASLPAEIDWYDNVAKMSVDASCEVMAAEDPLFILYTSGSTGKPKGILHTTGGYLVYAAMTFQYTFDYQPGEVYWCTADIGWITGHSYLVYGPLACGATSLVYEGVPNWPKANRFCQIIDKYQVNIVYTAPTAIRGLMAAGDEAIAGTQRTSLRILGSVGEPINPAAWQWYHDKIGNDHCPIMDTWWQTETGGFMITPLPATAWQKPGSATRPFFGIQPALMDANGQLLTGAAEGNLVIADSWPGQARTIYGDHARFYQTYFSAFPGYYFSGDGARRDQQGDYWITGRVDDVLNLAGHRLGTAEIESALVAHGKVAEAAVVGIPHAIKGQAIYAYVALNQGEHGNGQLTRELIEWVRERIGHIATIQVIQWTKALPKTRSGKIMRRILRKIANQEYQQLGDVSTLADNHIVETLIEEQRQQGLVERATPDGL